MKLLVALILAAVTSVAVAYTCHTNCYTDVLGNQHCTTTCY